MERSWRRSSIVVSPGGKGHGVAPAKAEGNRRVHPGKERESLKKTRIIFRAVKDDGKEFFEFETAIGNDLKKEDAGPLLRVLRDLRQGCGRGRGRTG